MRAVYFSVLATFLILTSAQTTASAQFGPAPPRSHFAGKTHLTYDSEHGSQVEYLSNSGGAYLWYPGNSVVLPGAWKMEMRNRVQRICFRYGANTYNPVTRQAGANWSCIPAAWQARRIRERAAGDPFGLSRRAAVPMRMPRGQFTLVQLRNMLP